MRANRSLAAKRFLANKQPVRWDVVMFTPDGTPKIIAHAVTERRMDIYLLRRNIDGVEAHPRR